MLKIFILFTLLFSALYAKDKVEIYASSMESQGDIVKAEGGVLVVYKGYLLSAKKAEYNRKSGNLELFDNIRVTHGKQYKILGSYAKLNIIKKERMFKPFFMLEKKSEVWMSAGKARAKDKYIDISSGVISGCNPIDPLWQMDFSSSNYDAESKWVNLYNARLYIYDIPVFYLPYFGYSLDKTRRTGLLKPSLGISSSEGFYYEQPIYIAPMDWWDLEIKPQIRTTRGNGIYSTFRFVDSKVSYGQLTAGYFKEKNGYYQSNNLVHQNHYGFNFLYNNKDFINQWFSSSLKGQSGLYADINNMNDVDYINLSSNDASKYSTSTQVLSRVNLFYNTDRNYLGAYFKYYKDLTLENNDNTLQKLPTLQYHSYLDSFFKNHLFYNLDIQSNNIQRKINKTVIQTNINLPVTFQTSLFDEYLNISYTANLYAQHSKFGGKEKIVSQNRYDNGFYARNYHTVTASTELTKAYTDFTHVISFGSTYTLSGGETKNGYYDDYKDFCSDIANKNESVCEFYNITNVDRSLQLDFSQYIYDSALRQIFYQRLAQKFTYGVHKNVGELENEMEYQVTKEISFYNDMFYNFSEHAFSKIYNTVSYSDSKYRISLSHLYKDSFLKFTSITPRYTSYMTSSIGYTYNNHYSYNFKFNYDLKAKLKKSAEVGFLYKKRCWDFGIKYAEDNRPILTQNGTSSIYDKYIYLTVILKPFMSSNANDSNFAIKLPQN